MTTLNPFSIHKNVSFEYAGSIDSGVELLSKYVTKPAWQLKVDDGLIGKISNDNIEIWLHRPFSKNFLLPVFKGKFSASSGKSVLAGEFQLNNHSKKGFALAMVGIIAWWVYIAIADHDLLKAKSMLMAPLWYCIGTLLLMVVALYLCRPIANKDMESIEQQIRNILTQGCI